MAYENGGILLPPAGQCAICAKPIGQPTHRARATIETYRAGEPFGPAFEINACCEAHLAEGLRAYAAAMDAGRVPRFGDDPVKPQAWNDKRAIAEEWNW